MRSRETPETKRIRALIKELQRKLRSAAPYSQCNEEERQLYVQLREAYVAHRKATKESIGPT